MRTLLGSTPALILALSTCLAQIAPCRAQVAPANPDIQPDLVVQPDQPATQRPESPWVTDERNLRAEFAAIEDRSARIRTELADKHTLDNLPEDHWARRWAGEYYVGDGLGMNVQILVAPDAGITYTWHGCMGLYDGNHGQITGTFDLNDDAKPDGLTIEWTLHPQTDYDFDSERFFFVPWLGPDGAVARRYLVPEDQMLAVVNDVLSGWGDDLFFAPRLHELDAEGQLMRRWNDAAVVGAPHVPEPWASMLSSPADFGLVTHVENPTIAVITRGVESTTCRVTIDAGASDGVFLGLRARYGQPFATSTLTAIEVNDGSSVFEFQSFNSEGTAVSVPAVGERIRLRGREPKPDAP